MKLIKWSGILVLVAGLAGGVWWWKRSAAGAPQYQTTVVTRGELTLVVTATGQLNPVTNVQVGCQISGTLLHLFADYNSPVTNGQVVAQLDPKTYQANLNQTRGELANAQAALELSQINATRAKELFAARLIPQTDFDIAAANLRQTEAQVQVRSAIVENARINLERCTIYSPVDGIVISRSVDVGQTVAASLNAPILFQIANDLTRMQINAHVAEADVGNVTDGQAVTFTVDAFPNRTFPGRVRQVRNAPLTVQNVVTYDTVIEVNNRDLKLKPGMTANVSITVAQRADVLKLANTALRYRPAAAPTTGGQRPGTGRRREQAVTRTVYTLDAASKPQPVQIKTGITDGVATEVTEGLNEGDQVITSATARPTSAAPQNPFSPTMPRRF